MYCAALYVSKDKSCAVRDINVLSVSTRESAFRGTLQKTTLDVLWAELRLCVLAKYALLEKLLRRQVQGSLLEGVPVELFIICVLTNLRAVI
jgi:hypothetical protein